MPPVLSKGSPEWRQHQLSVLYAHTTLNLIVLMMPFTHRADIYKAMPKFAGDATKVAAVQATISSAAALFEFLVNPTCGKLSDQYGRKFFMNLGPCVNVALKALVYLNPNETTIAMDRILSSSLSTVAGTTVGMAAMSDVFAGDSKGFAIAGGGLKVWVGLGLMAGPFLGSTIANRTRLGHRGAFLAASVVAALQLANLARMDETLPLDKRRPFDPSAMNPFTFLRFFTGRGDAKEKRAEDGDDASAARRRARRRRVLFTLCVVTGVMQNIPEGKNVSDMHQAYSTNDAKMTPKERSNFVSFVGLCALLNGASTKYLVPMLGGPAFTSFCNIISAASFVWYATMPISPFGGAWAMFAGALIGCPGWAGQVYTRAKATEFAVEAGWGRGEFSGALANLRAMIAVLAPVGFGKIYVEAAKRGRPGLGYMSVALCGVLTELMWQTLSKDDLEPPKKEGKAIKGEGK